MARITKKMSPALTPLLNELFFVARMPKISMRISEPKVIIAERISILFEPEVDAMKGPRSIADAAERTKSVR